MCVFTSKKKMATGGRKRTRFGFDIKFRTEEDKEAFVTRLESIRDLMTPSGSAPLDNNALMYALFDMAENYGAARRSSSHTHTVGSFLEHSGVYASDSIDSDQELYVVEKRALENLCTSIVRPCSCANYGSWYIASMKQIGHVARLEFGCTKCRSRRTWASSRIFGGHYLVNQRLVHAFTCAGMLPSQYIRFSQFSGIGTVGKWYIKRVYHSRSYIDVVSSVALKSMNAAVEEAKANPEYPSKGEWVMTDARHDSTKNAYHTTVPCLSGSTKKIVGVCTLSRKEHSTAQTRELACTKEVLSNVTSRGLNITEVAHDYNTQLRTYVAVDLGLVNSFDTWHGTKNVARVVKKIAQGGVRSEGKTWFAQLSDKMKGTKTHIYWSMKNSGGNADKLKQNVMATSKHYQGIHTDCHEESSCRRPGYSSGKLQLTDPNAIQAYEKVLRSTLVYRNAEDFCRCRDTFWVESFNHQLLTYTPKRIHFTTTTFIMRMNLAVLDWNENSQRLSTSERYVFDLRRPDRRTTMKVLVKKTYHFVEEIWMEYFMRNKNDLRPLVTEEDDSSEEDEGGEDDLAEDGDALSSEDEYEMDSDS